MTSVVNKVARRQVSVSPHTSTVSCQYSLQCSVLNFILTIALSEGQAGEAWKLSRTTMFYPIPASSAGHCWSVFTELAFPLGADDILSIFRNTVHWFYSSVFLRHLQHHFPLPHSVHSAPKTIVSLHQGFLS